MGSSLATPWGERAASESETAVGLGTLRPSHCCQWRWGQPAQISLLCSTSKSCPPAGQPPAQPTPSTAIRSQIRWLWPHHQLQSLLEGSLRKHRARKQTGGSLKSPAQQIPPCARRLRAGEEPARRGLASWGRRGPQLSLQLVETKFSSKRNKPLFLPWSVSFWCLCQDCKNLKRFPWL